MFIENFNQLTRADILDWVNVNQPIRISFNNKPNHDNILLLNTVLVNKKDITLVLVSKQHCWIDFNDFSPLILIEYIEVHNTTLEFNSIAGIGWFKNLRSLKLLYKYNNDIDLQSLTACTALEELVLDLPLTNNHYATLANLTAINTLKLVKFNADLLNNELVKVESLEVYDLQCTDLNSKMPNLKRLRIFNANKLTDVSFISQLAKLEELFLYGLNNIEALPDLSCLGSLQKLSLQNMKKLTDIANVKTIHSPFELRLRATGLTLTELFWLSPEMVPNLNQLSVELKSKKETKQLNDRFSHQK